ncbi:MAG: HDOD domain-containing protein [Syntrophorhabdales bacterium]|nr:HDOD domain-containing protein [Syntrophorhabdales bacterium]
MVRQRLLSKAFELRIAPSLQCIIDSVIEIATNAGSSLQDMLKIVEVDPALTAKVLSIANSAYYNRGTVTQDLNHALIKIGLNEAKNILLCLLLVENMLRTLRIRLKDLLEFWRHSLYVASSARIFAEKTLEYDPQKVYVASLLHDIGKVILYSDMDNYSDIVRMAYEKEIPVWEREREEYGTDHQEVGYIIAKKWRLPEGISYVIYRHHEPRYGEEKYNGLIRINMIADNFYYSQDTNGGPEMSILLKEKNNITMELDKVMEIINIHDHGR